MGQNTKQLCISECLSIAAEGDIYFTGPCETPVTIDMVGTSTVDKVGKKTILLKTTGHEKCRYTIALVCMYGWWSKAEHRSTYREYWRRIRAHTWTSPGPRCRTRRPVVGLASPATHWDPGPHPLSRPDTSATHWTFQHHQDLLPPRPTHLPWYSKLATVWLVYIDINKLDI